jgi:geranylgeranyl pyrophosphate synthase
VAYKAAGGGDLMPVIPLAAAVEFVHTASVVHDDINDHGVMRRGRPSVNALWGRTFALLTGDYLFTKVYELMAPYKDLNIDLAAATVALVEGETLQASAVKENNFSRQVYYKIIALKTAALFKAAAIMGAKMAEASPTVIEALAQYGFNVGLAFQIVDDILDLTADTEQLGKTAGIDLAQGRGFAAAHTANGGAMVAEPMVADDPVETIKRRAMQGDTLLEAQQQAEMLVQAAINSLDPLSESSYKGELIKLARLVIERSR